MSGKERQDRLTRIFDEAFDLPRAQRDAFLAEVCGEDRELFAEIVELLSSAGEVSAEVVELLSSEGETSGSLGDAPEVADGSGDASSAGTLDSAAAVLDPGDDDATRGIPEPAAAARPERVRATGAPQSIGPYKILETLGEGGMGVVYLAEQQKPVRRRVALKLIKTGMDTKEVVARFEAERQALAMMDHPNIARIYDAGATDDGRPYFVMEHIRGVPLGEYCDRHKLPLRQRLKLFTQVCQGVEHAHRRGIIHRDLKPSNVLVSTPDQEPVAKIIDFGVARATNQRLTEKTLYTELGRAVGTPAYMSPEQAELSGEDVDHRTDVYSLGVMLYELLVGEPPLDPELLAKAGFDEILRQIREEDPPTPSTRWTRLNVERVTLLATRRKSSPGELLGMFRGDLDWITMKAVEKERERRYSSASELADDIVRHLEGDPVEAGPPGVAYRLGKYVRKNRVFVLAGSAVIVALTIGMVVSLVFFVTARRERENAEAQRDIAQRQRENAEEQRENAEEQRENAEEQRDIAQRERDNAMVLSGRLFLDERRTAAEELWVASTATPPGAASEASAEALRAWLADTTGRVRRITELAPRLVAEQVLPASQLAPLQERLTAFRDADPRRGTVAWVEARLGAITGDAAHRSAWEKAIEAVGRAGGAYDGLKIEAANDLLPLGADTDSGLWEFLHLRTQMVLVLIPGGTFRMGSPESEEGRDDNQGPVHEVTLSPFLIAKYECTQAQYEAVTGRSPSRFKGNDLPVTQVSWNNCQEFCEKTGLSLPTEAQWEYACRAGTTTAYHSGDTEADLEEVAWYHKNSGGETHSFHPFGKKKPNGFGLHDMHGNVLEWCEDVFDAEYYSKAASRNGDKACTSGSVYRVSRGGSWYSSAGYCRSASRSRYNPAGRADFIGFRPLRPLP